jgi:hypothetical protein
VRSGPGSIRTGCVEQLLTVVIYLRADWPKDQGNEKTTVPFLRQECDRLATVLLGAETDVSGEMVKVMLDRGKHVDPSARRGLEKLGFERPHHDQSLDTVGSRQTAPAADRGWENTVRTSGTMGVLRLRGKPPDRPQHILVDDRRQRGLSGKR